MNSHKTKLIVALDTKDADEAERWATQVGPYADIIKIGLEFSYACGLRAVSKLGEGRKIFLDLKLHDIPNTVASAIGSVSIVKPDMLTVHASGGSAMVKAARNALEEHFSPEERPLLLAVTVLTSLDRLAYQETVACGGPRGQVLRLGELAMVSGADGLVCSPQEISLLRSRLGSTPKLIVPGIRPAGAGNGDQKRVMTPAEARDAGADWIVVGRPITRSEDPAAAAEAIAKELEG
ncbi:orotidine-5'-phosphate decarboxylase [Entomobacter blattae]|uniref:Orotidine 5'-phosphate decarboxylase n=1 Tax=Entomobacter blattae TaxID=2762277 RepID=A0A7H1NPC9_9PROT|nr:orotidine-5'-phosphate decarboxylase [Entomobacter blattae]QNT77639.1 Orotidine 5'-phosphate decarboxylase [Entomobacter blattae]